MADNTRKAAVDILFNFSKNRAPVSDEINKFRMSSDMDTRDIRLVNELVNGTLRNLEYIDYVISRFSTLKLNKISTYVLSVLRISVYQILFMDKIPDSAAVNEGTKLAKKANYRAAGFVNAVLRKVSANEGKVVLPENRTKYISTRYSCPEWIVKEWIKHLGDEAEALAEAMNKKPATMLRVNTLKTNRKKLIKTLTEEGWECCEYDSPVFPEIDYLISAERIENISESHAYKDGLFYIQDSAGAYAGHVLSPVEGSIVLDMCSSPGGKTTHLAQIMNNSGIIHAFDVSDMKIKKIIQNRERLGITCIKPQVSDSTVVRDEFIEVADYILVDSPCSGLGIIRKKPDIKYLRTPSDSIALADISLKILETASRYLKSGGKMVFSTCTTLYNENEGVLGKFLSSHPEFKLKKIECNIENDGFITLYPHRNDCDGFFISLLTKE